MILDDYYSLIDSEDPTSAGATFALQARCRMVIDGESVAVDSRDQWVEMIARRPVERLRRRHRVIDRFEGAGRESVAGVVVDGDTVLGTFFGLAAVSEGLIDHYTMVFTSHPEILPA